MELRQLRYFLQVADQLHFGRAAERLRVAPSAVSQQVSRLERELGVPLLDRSHRTVRLTDAGERFRPLAQQVLDAETAAVAEMRALSGRQERLVRLGTSAGLGARVSELVHSCQRADPPITLQLNYSDVNTRLHQVRSGTLDAAVVRGDSRATDEFDFTHVWTDELLVALPSAHPLAGRRRIPFGELAGLPLRIAPAQSNPDLYHAVQQAAAVSGFEPVIAGEFGAALHEAFAELAIGPPSWTVFYASHADTLAIPGVAFRPVEVGKKARPLSLATFVVTDGTRRLSGVLADFLQRCRELGRRAEPRHAD